MNVAVFTNKYPARVATFFERDLRALIDAGIQVDVFAIYPLDPTQWRYSLDLLGPEQLPRDRIHHLRLREAWRQAGPIVRARRRECLHDAGRVLAAAARYGPAPLAKTAYVLPKAWAWAAQFPDRYDHVLAYWGNYAATCAYMFHRLLPRPVPFSIWLHAGADLYRTPAFLRQKLAYADTILTCCEFNRSYLRRAYPDQAEGIDRKLHVCYHGLDVAQFVYRPDHRPAARVIAVGRLARHKGFDHLLWAAFMLRARGIEIEVELVGDGPERRALRTLARDLGIADQVRFRGWLLFAEARQAMSEATILVHPSSGLGDGLPNVVREAMAVGTPVIASDVAGIPEALDQGCGVLVPPGDPAALADALDRLLHDPSARRAIAERARRRVEERYDLWRNGAHLAELLRSTRRSPGGSDLTSDDAASPPLESVEAPC